MDFKSSILQDIDKVFLNTSEFAETVTINGKQMEIVPDTDGVNLFNSARKVALFDFVFQVATSNFDNIPQSERLMDFEGEEYRIKSVSNNMGMLTIALSRLDA